MNFFSKQHDFVSIGDTVTDAFIRLNPTSAHVEFDHGSGREICLRFGDKIPYDDVYVVAGVGNAANAAVSAARLGLNSAFVSNVGDDDYGREILDVMKAEKVAAEFIKVNKGYKTNYHYVLWYGDERTILIKHQPYEYSLPDIGEPKWVYFSSLGENSLQFHEAIADYLDAHSSVKFAFQPGTFQMKFGKDKLKRIYQRAYVFFCNREEAQRILGTEESDIKKILKMVADIGPKIVVITDGVKGAYVYDGTDYLFMRLYPDPKPPLQRTGAGDAFSSTFTVALALGKDIKEALRWGPVNSMSVVQGIGARAGLLSRDKLEEYLKSAPTDYYPKLI